MGFSRFLNSNFLILLILSSMIMYNIFSFDLQWNEPKEIHIDLSEHISYINSNIHVYPMKIFQTTDFLYYGIWYVTVWGGEDFSFFGSTNDYSSWSNLINLDYLFSSIEGELRACDFVVLENNSLALLGIKIITETVNETWITHQNLVMTLSNDLGTNWSPVLLINNTNLPSTFFGVYFNNGIKFWTIANYANQYVEYVSLWTYNESLKSISQTHVYQPESSVYIYRGSATSKEELFFLEHENNNYHLLSFNGSAWKRIYIPLIDKYPNILIISTSKLYLVYSSSDHAYYIGKLSIDNQRNEITISGSAKIIAASNWFGVWPILNSSIPTLFVLSYTEGVASVTKSINWEILIFTVLFSLFFIVLWIFPSTRSSYSKEEEK